MYLQDQATKLNALTYILDTIHHDSQEISASLQEVPLPYGTGRQAHLANGQLQLRLRLMLTSLASQNSPEVLSIGQLLHAARD